MSSRKFLEAAMNTDDSQLFFTVFKFFEQRNIRMRGSPKFQPGLLTFSPNYCDWACEAFLGVQSQLFVKLCISNSTFISSYRDKCTLLNNLTVRPLFFYFLVLGRADPIFPKIRIKIKVFYFHFIYIFPSSYFLVKKKIFFSLQG